DTDRDKVGDNADAFPNAKTEQRWESIALRTTLSDSDSACTLMDSEFIPYLNVATPDESVATDAMSTAVNFALEGCDSSGETVQITIDMGTTLPPNAAVYKVVGDKWTVIPGATISGSIVSYSITDNDGFLDQDPAMGRISDPVSVAVPRAGGNPSAIPAVPFLGLMALAIFIALWGTANLTSSRPSARR
ncbi:choice-of-anchor U domain-containing protein, partial [Congregibacter sp.]|uniref:choice-of-anchor U domain-containing protein n=1 Tax=Congregibacter sp. TaxID=2744308 RepID=UPI00385ABD22